ncbi:MAG: hypothetical protein Q4B06_01325 [Candidatus Saccharibacteria bacterium]|nr:hypothetical protein [Candidatus Saccharibacteria bacterium]
MDKVRHLTLVYSDKTEQTPAVDTGAEYFLTDTLETYAELLDEAQELHPALYKRYMAAFTHLNTKLQNYTAGTDGPQCNYREATLYAADLADELAQQLLAGDEVMANDDEALPATEVDVIELASHNQTVAAVGDRALANVIEVDFVARMRR